MVHVYNCHPFASQHIVAAEQEPGLVCCGGGALFVVSAGGCKIEAYNLQQEGCPLICRFSSMGSVLSIHHSTVDAFPEFSFTLLKFSFTIPEFAFDILAQFSGGGGASSGVFLVATEFLIGSFRDLEVKTSCQCCA